VQLRPGHSVQHLLLQQANVSWMLNKTGRSDWSTACHPHYGQVPTTSVLFNVTVTFDTMLDICWSESTHSEMGSVWKNTIYRTV